MTTEVKNFFVRRWEILITVLLIVFNVGYTVARIEDKTNKEEVQIIVKEAIKENADRYVKIEDGISLNERLKNIEKIVDEQKVLTQKIYDKLLTK